MSTTPTSLQARPSAPRSILAMALSVLLALTLGAAPALAVPANEGESASGLEAIEQGLQQQGDLQSYVNAKSSSVPSIGFSGGVSPLAASTLPPSFDLRNVDANGDGVPENYVTSVKLQNPWGTCWAFGTIAAMEESIAYDMGVPVTDEELDFSERHLAYFTFNHLPELDGDNQGGEGYHAVADGLNQEFNGGSALYSSSMVSSGVGPAPELYIPYQGANKIVANRKHHRIVDGQVLDDDGTVLTDEPAEPFEYWQGDDWSVPEDDRFISTFQIQQSNILPNTVTPVKGENNQIVGFQYDQAAIDAMKTELTKGNAIAIEFHADTSRPGEVVTGKYINLSTWAHYTYDGSDANHEVCVVGYDDNYSKDNFNADHQPPADGAWIVKNSWGASDNEFPNRNDWGVNGSGYFYISYYDTSVTGPETFEFNVVNSSTNKEFNIGQYDYMPAVQMPNISSQSPASMANVFTVNENQAVRALAAQTSTANTTVTYDLYRLKPDYASPTDGELVSSVTESYPYAGYHRVELDRSYVFTAGSPLSVVVTVKRADGSYEISYDQGPSKLAIDLESLVAKATGTYNPSLYNYYSEGVINPGESFVGAVSDADGQTQWTDWSTVVEQNVQASMEEIEERGYLDAIEKGDGAVLVQGGMPQNRAALFAIDNFPLKFYAEFLENELPFTDLGLGEGETPHWAALSGVIGEVYDRGLMTGYDEQHFGPNDPITRAQAAATLFSYANPSPSAEELSTLAESDTAFVDLAPEAWYLPAMKWAEQEGIFSGYPGDDGARYAHPDDPITREELAVILHRYAEKVGGDLSDDPALSHLSAPDASSVSDWAQSSVEWAFDHSLLRGYDTGELGPQNSATRAEYAKMLLSAIDAFEA